MTSNEQEYIDEIQEEYTEVFRNEPGKIRGHEYTIKLKNNTAINVRHYPIPMARQEAVEAEVKVMLDLGIIERSRSPHSIPIVPVFKKDGSVRLCLDAKKINE